MREVLFYLESLDEVTSKLDTLSEDVQRYLSEVESLAGDKLWKNYLNDYILYHNIPRLCLVDEEKVIVDRTLELVSRVLYQDLKEFYEANEG